MNKFFSTLASASVCLLFVAKAEASLIRTFNLLESGSFAVPPETEYWGDSPKNPFGSNLLMAKRDLKPKISISKKYPTNKFRVFSIDLDQDGELDYIIEKIGQRQTCFVKSDLTITNCEKFSIESVGSFAYEFFLAVGKNQTLLLLDLSGDGDSNHFSAYAFDPKTWKRKKLTTLNTLIQVDSAKYKGIYRGYPWDISDLPISFENNVSSVKIIFDNGLGNQNNGSEGPALVFKGHPTQGESTGHYDALKSKIKLVPLKELKQKLDYGQ